ncbi:hypothetical protein, partial [Vibrio scophthalmi]|uniref:hypothetical protein n=1 Tax=Vibrio scophthalmi TaxID=45658 RepID=UPI0019D40A93
RFRHPREGGTTESGISRLFALVSQFSILYFSTLKAQRSQSVLKKKSPCLSTGALYFSDKVDFVLAKT